MTLLPTPSQTVGPYLHIGLSWLTINRLTAQNPSLQSITISGRVLDGDGRPVPDALLELWQADSTGHFNQPDFSGFGRVPTDDQGRFEFTTIKPGAVDNAQGGKQSPHIAVSIFMRGLLKRLVTRIYFPDEPQNAADFILNLVPNHRRTTLIARQLSPDSLEWNVVLQGPNETVFFDC